METMTGGEVFAICRNLLDAGCDASTIEQFLVLERSGRRDEQRRLLSRHKAHLLEELHRAQYKIDCLDHMAYAMEAGDL